jgi:excisionase family DNA binding protein
MTNGEMMALQYIPLRQVADLPVDILYVLRQRQTAWKVIELSALLNLGKRTIYAAIESGVLPAMRFGGSIRLSPTDVLIWAESRTLGITPAGCINTTGRE